MFWRRRLRHAGRRRRDAGGAPLTLVECNVLHLRSWVLLSVQALSDLDAWSCKLSTELALFTSEAVPSAVQAPQVRPHDVVSQPGLCSAASCNFLEAQRVRMQVVFMT